MCLESVDLTSADGGASTSGALFGLWWELLEAAGLEVCRRRGDSPRTPGSSAATPNSGLCVLGGPLPSISYLTVVPDPSPHPIRLPAELIDMVCEAVLSRADETSRGEVATRLIREIHDTLVWLHPDPTHRERASFERVLGEVQAHQARVEGPPASGTAPVKAAR